MFNNEEATSNIFWSMKKTSELQIVSAISCRVESVSEVQIQERLSIEALVVFIMNFDNDGIE